MNSFATLLGRVGLSLLFIISGFGKLAAYAGTQQYMESQGVPGVLLPLVILTELGGGLAILSGFFTRWVAIVMALFTLASGVLFHLPHYSDQMQAINFWKNIAMAGGFLVLFANGAGAYSIDALRSRNK